MTRKISLLLFAAVLAMAVAPLASAQSTEPVEVLYHWGAIHKGPGQSPVFTFTVPDAPDAPASLPVEFQLTDKNGKVLFSDTFTALKGQVVSVAVVVAPELRFAQGTIEADVRAVIDPGMRTLVPSFRVLFPAGQVAPLDQLIPTLQVMDIFTGRVQVFSNTPRAVPARKPGRELAPSTWGSWSCLTESASR